MSKIKLTPDKIQTKRRELLKDAEKITRQISQMSHLVEEDGEEFTRFVGYVKDLNDAWFGFVHYDVPVHVVDEHQKDISQVIYNGGIYQVLCDVVKSRLKAGNYTMTTSASVCQGVDLPVTILTNFAFQNAAGREAMSKRSDFLSTLVHTLKADHRAHVNNEMSEEQTDLLDGCMKFLNNCAMDEKNVPRVRDVGTVKAFLLYLGSHEGRIQVAAIAGLAKLVNEEEAQELLTHYEAIFTLLVQRLEIATESSYHSDGWGWGVMALIKTMRRLARNDANKQVLVDKGCLPLLVKTLDSPYDYEAEEALQALWILSFDKDNKQKMVDEPNLVKRVWGKYSDSSSYDEIKKSCYGILWSLKEHLEKGGLEFVGIAALIEKKKTKADMKPTREYQRQAQRKSSDDDCSKGHVMMSYQWGHQEIILQISEELKNAGVPVWIDVDLMEGSVLETMAKAVEDCSIFIMAVSRGYKESCNTRLEAEYAHKKKKIIIPLMMEQGYEPDGWLGIIMGNKMYYDFSGKYPFDNKMSELLKVVRKRMGSK